jgi:hypothetical protein
MQKSYQANAPRQTKMDRQATIEKKQRRHNSTYPKGGVSCSKDSFVVNQTLVFQIKFCGKSPALRVAAKRYLQGYDDRANHQRQCYIKTTKCQRFVKLKEL